MMKKKYIAPTQQVVEMGMKTILCGSITLSSESQDNDVALSREFYFDGEW